MKASRVIAAVLLTAVAEGCSNFYMGYTNASFRLSARTMDLSSDLDWIIHAFPRGQSSDVLGTRWTSKYGYVAFTPKSVAAMKRRFKLDDINLGVLAARDFVSEGMNTEGLSCGFLTLEGSKFQSPDLLHPHRNVFSQSLCKWVLENFSNVEEVQAALPGMRFTYDTATHFVIQDAGPKSIVVEFMEGEQLIHEDLNDGVETFGIMTNEPRFEWQLQNVKHLEWKNSLARSSVSVPGNWYPDERYLRIHLVKSGIERTKQPTTYRQAVANTVAVLNSVTVPMGDIPGTDSEASGGEGLGDHTQWGLIRDHRNRHIYIRSETNPSFRRISLTELALSDGDPVQTMEIEQDPFYIDVSPAFKPSEVTV